MDSQYTIIDSRLLNDFKIKTFSGFKKNDVFNILFKSIDANKVENACNWIAECIVSGYTLTIFDKLISYACRVVHINNPKLPFFLLNKTQILHNQLQKLNTKNKDVVIILRNSQMIRNMFFDIITTLCASSKTNVSSLSSPSAVDLKNGTNVSLLASVLSSLPAAIRALVMFDTALEEQCGELSRHKALVWSLVY